MMVVLIVQDRPAPMLEWAKEEETATQATAPQQEKCRNVFIVQACKPLIRKLHRQTPPHPGPFLWAAKRQAQEN